MNIIAKLDRNFRQPLQDDSNLFIREGWEMAQKEGHASFQSIELLHAAELEKVRPNYHPDPSPGKHNSRTS